MGCIQVDEGSGGGRSGESGSSFCADREVEAGKVVERQAVLAGAQQEGYVASYTIGALERKFDTSALQCREFDARIEPM